MKPARLLRVLRTLLPGLVTLLAVLITVLPLGVSFAAVVTPFLSLMAVYYWSIYRPDLLPPAAVFANWRAPGHSHGGPVGLLALVLLLVQALAVSQRRILLGQAFSVEWAGLLLVAVGGGFGVLAAGLRVLSGAGAAAAIRGSGFDYRGALSLGIMAVHPCGPVDRRGGVIWPKTAAGTKSSPAVRF